MMRGLIFRRKNVYGMRGKSDCSILLSGSKIRGSEI
jgi:hypothetical protein